VGVAEALQAVAWADTLAVHMAHCRQVRSGHQRRARLPRVGKGPGKPVPEVLVVALDRDPQSRPPAIVVDELGSPVHILITFGFLGSHQMVKLIFKLMKPLIKLSGCRPASLGGYRLIPASRQIAPVLKIARLSQKL